MKKVITISIPEPCHEDWAAMSPTEKGRHCQVCTKEVVDFTNKTDEAIVKHVLKNKNACGRFKPQQLDRDLVLERKSTASFAPYAASLLLPLTLLNGQRAQAQGQTKIIEKPLISLGIGSRPTSNKIQITTTGKVTDSAGNPMVNVHISVKERNQSVRTFSDGTFSITTLNDETLFFQIEGYEIQQLTLGRTNSAVAIVMNTSEVEIMLLGEIAPMIDEEIQGDMIEIIEEIEESEDKAQSDVITISGTVTDNDGLPLPGVNIIMKDTSTGTQSDFDGNYSIKTNPHQVLIFSYGGYDTKTITASTISNSIDIKMKPNANLRPIPGVAGGIRVHYSN